MLEFDYEEDADRVTENNSLSTLLDMTPSGLFPGGTKIFPSKFHLQQRTWKLLAGSAVYNIISLLVVIFAANGSEQSSTVATVFLILLVLFDGALVFVVWRWNTLDFRMYEEMVDRGLWLEGVFVFSTGDVVVRFNDLFRKVEMEFDSGTVSEAIARESENLLIIVYTDLSGRKQEYKVECDRLTNSASEIAQCINARDGQHYV
ncbi:Hypothetical Protein FCC1311_016602 [Hondaea fermentalgiana]|uniref:Uncharacterized protein n=1 Tax=Hondaea fermentalgiana TaxID=2315210 RepID=A0A2R5G360_9STRA|nr:Hypothetical Protein FCC1311_016602 [Hondaea fermentalgiana]|eukprot:GBG25442.1 Hypothetical Protein FCC1311_016602 [Hondaea fermentalgiana]